MADRGPRCKRRKQANPRRTSVTKFTNGLEASSDSDDEDKLHIVEDDSLQDPEADGTPQQEAVLSHNGSWNGVKAESEEEASVVEEVLQDGDTPIIFPEAPDEDQSPEQTGGADENGTPDSFSQLHICPYCSRGYKRNASLKEHVKYRHETSEDNFSCSHCSYTFTYRSQLEKHMGHHKSSRQQNNISSGAVGGAVGGAIGTRKFKCTECDKAFKYKHHLKEHLRIHSGEKPYECSNCKRRFSHSGSYSSHISSKKCLAAVLPNGAPWKAIVPSSPTNQKTPITVSPTHAIEKDKTVSKPLQEQLPVTQIKTEPVEYECKPAMDAPAAPAGSNGVVNGGVTQAAVAAPLPQGVAMVLPTVGVMSPISINLSDLQNVLKVAMDGNVLRQVLGTANGVVAQGKQGIVVQQPQQQIISLPAFVDHDGTTKIIINYSISPSSAAAPTTPAASLILKNILHAPPLPVTAKPTETTASKTNTPTPEVADLSLVKPEPESVPVTITEPDVATETKVEMGQATSPEMAERPKTNSANTCLLCDECPDGLEALHLLQHRKAANGEAVDSAALDPSFAALLKEAGVTLEEPPVDDLLSLLHTYFASNANPGEEELNKISESVSIPADVIRKWFDKMNSGKKVNRCNNDCTDVSKQVKPVNVSPDATVTQNGEAEEDSFPNPQVHETSAEPSPEAFSASDSSDLMGSINDGDLVIVKSEPEDPEPPDSQAEPLDLSLPKQNPVALNTTKTPPPAQPQQPVSLNGLRKEQLAGRTIYVTAPNTANPVNIVTATQLPTLVAIAGQGAVGCLSAVNSTTKRTILIPQLTYTYATTASSTTDAKTVVLNGHTQETRADSGSEVAAEEQHNDSDSTTQAKKRRLETGIYPCDLCSKVFQKGSSLLRHKYEHTGKRPHECSVCKKAFKHKHHLIEHSRLHSGEKPYQCDKCGKRFSHSGSYSQHMNHRYSYCKKVGSSSGSRRAPSNTGSTRKRPHSESRTATPHSHVDSDERGSEEDDDEAICMDDIRVVQVDDGECEIYEGHFEDEEDEDEDDEVTGDEAVRGTEDEPLVCEVLEIQLGSEDERTDLNQDLDTDRSAAGDSDGTRAEERETNAK